MGSKSKAMRRGRDQDGHPRGAGSQCFSPARRLLTVVVLFSFGIQFGRFYLPASADPHLCPEQSLGEAADTHGEHSHHPVQDITPPDPEGGPYFEHCKEYVYGLGLTTVQPMAEPGVLAFPWTPSVSVALLPTLLPFPQNDLTTPFHPPRHLS